MTTTDSTPLISKHDRPAPAHPTAILAIILVSYFMIILDSSIVLTACRRSATSSASPRSGAASGLVNASSQLGGSLGLGILTAVGVTSAAGATGADEALAQRVAGVLTAGSVLLALALAVSVVCIARMPRRGRARTAIIERGGVDGAGSLPGDA